MILIHFPFVRMWVFVLVNMNPLDSGEEFENVKTFEQMDGRTDLGQKVIRKVLSAQNS